MTDVYPQAIYAEVAILGACMLYPTAIHDAVSVLIADDFSLDSHRRIFDAIVALATAGLEVDTLSVRTELARRKSLEAVGGSDYLFHLGEGIPRNLSVENHVRTVQDKATARRGIQACQAAIEGLQAAESDATEVLDDLSKRLSDDRPDTTKTILDVMPRALALLKPEGRTIIPTGIEDLDYLIGGGLKTKQFSIIGAQPSFGKSALCRQIERSAVRAGFGIHSFTIEVADDEWLLHHVFRIAGVPSWLSQKPEKMEPHHQEYIERAAREMEANWNYRLDDPGSLRIEGLLAKARFSALRHGTKLFTIDYMQLLVRDSRNRHQELSLVADKLRQFAKDYDVAVLGLSQMARGGDVNKKPSVQDLKESGDLEAAANLIIMPYRPKNPETQDFTGQDELIVGKHRNGAVGTCPMFFDYKTLSFGRRP